MPHSVILDSLPETDGTLPVEVFVDTSNPAGRRSRETLKFQRWGEGVVSAFVRHQTHVPVGFREPLFRGLTTFLLRSRVANRFRDRFAWGSWEPVETAHFIDPR